MKTLGKYIPHKGSHISPIWRYIGTFMRDISMLYDICPKIVFNIFINIDQKSIRCYC
jgi:hypothetical protein